MNTKKIIIYLTIVILICTITLGLFFLCKVNYFQNKVTFDTGNNNLLDTLKSLTSKNDKISGIADGRMNILLMGIAGKGKPGQFLTDTIMVMSVNTDTGQIALLSLPRDLLVTIPKTNVQMKINSAYQYGLTNGNGENDGAGTVEKVVENVTSLRIDRYVVLNFDGFQRVIDSIGGINITSERDIYDPRYPGPNYSYEVFDLKKGFHQMDGATALKYARERHDDPQGDFGRALRQQQIMEATRNKVFSAGTYLNVVAINNLFDALGDNIRTDIKPDEFPYFLDLVKRVNTGNINNKVVDAWSSDSLLKVTHVNWNGVQAFVLIPRAGSWSEVQDLAQNIFDLNALKRRQDEIAKEDANIFMIDKSGSNLSGKISNLLQVSFGHKNVAILKDSDVKSTEDATQVFDLSGNRKPFTLDELVKKIPARVGGDIPENYKKIAASVSPDFLIVIGKDSIPRYNMTEDSIEDYKNATETNDYTEFVNK